MLAKKLAILLCAALSLSSCVPKPPTTQKGGVNKAQTQNEMNVESELNNNDNAAAEKNILLGTPENYSINFQGGTNKIIVDAVVTVPPTAEGICTYQLDRSAISEEQTKSIAKSFWGEKSSELVWNEQAHIYTMNRSQNSKSYYTYRIKDNMFVIDLKGADYNPYPENRVTNEKDYKGIVKNSEAIKICEKVLSDMNLKAHKIGNVTMYGQGGNHPYMNIDFVLYQNGIPIFSRNKTPYINFIVDDNGIGEMIGYNFTLQRQETVKKIISVEAAVDVLAKNIDAIILFGNDEFDKTQIDNYGNITELNIGEITFQYCIRKTLDGKTIVSPAWGFWLKNSLTDSKTTISVAVDAITGEVII